MTVSQDPREQTVRAFIKRKTVSSVLIYIAFFFIFIGIISKRYAGAGVTITGLAPDTELALGLGIGIALLLITYYFWRCPACGKSIGFKVDVKACPHCKSGFTPYWKPDNEQRVYNAYARIKKTRYFVYVLLIMFLFFSVSMAGQLQPIPISSLYVVLGGIVMAFGIGDLLFWRCPNCKSHLGRGWNPAACPRCDASLRK
jgi:hypothetical protein